MRLLSVAVTASVIMASLIGCASSHTKRHEYTYHMHAYGGASEHRHERPRYPGHGHHYNGRHSYSRPYRRPPPPPQPGRTPDGRYVLPGGLESVCAGGTPPPCQ